MSQSTNSMLIALADAVTAAFNAGSFAASLTAVVKFLPLTDFAKFPAFNPTDPATLLIYVIPLDDDENRIGGGLNPQFTGEYDVEVIIYAKVGVGDAADASCRTLMDVRQQLRTMLKPAGLLISGVYQSRVTLTDIKGNLAYETKALLLEHVFASSQVFKFVVPT